MPSASPSAFPSQSSSQEIRFSEIRADPEEEKGGKSGHKRASDITTDKEKSVTIEGPMR